MKPRSMEEKISYLLFLMGFAGLACTAALCIFVFHKAFREQAWTALEREADLVAVGCAQVDTPSQLETYVDGSLRITLIASDGSVLFESATNQPMENHLSRPEIQQAKRSKGSILGAKTRMEELACDPHAYIRPSPSAGSLGGVARKTREAMLLCEAAGFDITLIETVGVGQSETAVHSMVDFFLLVQIAGAGDELQGIKRGIMEMADSIIINKADGNNITRAELAKVQLQNALHLFPPHESGVEPKVMTCSAYEKTGIKEIWENILHYCSETQQSKYFDIRRSEQAKYWMYETIDEQLRNRFYQSQKEQIKEAEEKVQHNEESSFAAAFRLLDNYFKEDTKL